MSDNLNFEREKAILNKIYSDAVEAINAKPNYDDIENLRLYVDNVYALLNRIAIMSKDVKKFLEEREPKSKHETYNSPA